MCRLLNVTISVQRPVFVLNLKLLRSFNHTHDDPNAILIYVLFTSLTHIFIKKKNVQSAMNSLDLKNNDNFRQHSTADYAISNYRINDKLERAL